MHGGNGKMEPFAPHSLGDGKTRFEGIDEDGQPFTLAFSLRDFFDWYDSLKKPEGADSRWEIKVVRDHIAERCGVRLNLDQADELLAASHYHLMLVGKGQAQRLASL